MRRRENLILTQADQNMKLVFERTGGQDGKGDLIDSDLPQTYLPMVAVDSGLFPQTSWRLEAIGWE